MRTPIEERFVKAIKTLASSFPGAMEHLSAIREFYESKMDEKIRDMNLEHKETQAKRDDR